VVFSVLGLLLLISFLPSPSEGPTVKNDRVLPWQVKVPPINQSGNEPITELDAPLSEWEVVDSFATKDECRRRLLDLRMAGATGRQGTFALGIRYSAGRCVFSPAADKP
jgi:hypothetical protein